MPCAHARRAVLPAFEAAATSRRPVADEPAKSISSPGTHPGCGSAR